MGIKERKIKYLADSGSVVYVYLSNLHVAKSFIKHAEDEDFSVEDGAASVAVICGRDIRYVVFGNHEELYAEDITKIDYEKYIDGTDDYIIK